MILIPIKKIEDEILGFSMRQELLKNGILFQKKIKTQVMDTRLKKTNVEFNKLIKLKNLGEGQFGKVILVEDQVKGHKFALKCMSKK